ncbi:MAG: tRNA-dihydrouridine synthase family protein [Planctomycetes bacterium]|nr:tRNA-dihydrouridine synthase family protein [Planctomycetota bacterium]
MMQIGKLTLDAPFFQAGLAGYSDAAMRLIARRHGAPYCVTEAMLDVFLLNGGKGLKAAELDDEDHPIAGQLMGSNPDEIAAGAKILVSLGYDVIDVNLACPVKKIRKKARGGHLMQEPADVVAILDAVRQAVPGDIPCSVKLRRGTDDTPEATQNFHHIFEAVIRLGYAAATVHGRTVEQKYLGPSRWEFLAGIVKQYGLDRPGAAGEARRFSLFGSGDIWCAADVFRMMKETGVHGVSVARGCIGNPWVFTQARAILAGDAEAATRPPTIAQQRAVLLEHFDLSMRLHGERAAGMMMRKFGIKFSRHHPEADRVAKAFIAVHSAQDWLRVLDDAYLGDGPGAATVTTPVADAPMNCEDDSCDAAATV